MASDGVLGGDQPREPDPDAEDAKRECVEVDSECNYSNS